MPLRRQVFYKWQCRFDELGEAGLRDGSSRPHHSPTATDPEIVGKVIYLRRHYHFGPGRIAMYLKRYHDVSVSTSGVWRILKRLELNRLPASQRYKLTATVGSATRNNSQVTASKSTSSSWSRSGGRRKHYQYTAIDDCTRLRVLRVYPRNNQKTAIQFIDDVLAKLPFKTECVQTDNGAEFQGAFHWHLLDRGIQHVYIRPRTPRLNGKVERSHRIDSEEFYRLLDGVVIDDTGLFTEKLQEWEDFYNFHRPHDALAGQTPYERLRQKATTPTA